MPWIKIEMVDPDKEPAPARSRPAPTAQLAAEGHKWLAPVLGLVVMVLVLGAVALALRSQAPTATPQTAAGAIYNPTGSSGAAGNTVPVGDLPAVVARVNGKDITNRQLVNETNLNIAMLRLTQRPVPPDDPQSQRLMQVQVLNEVIDGEILSQEAARQGVMVTDQQALQALAQVQGSSFTDAQLQAELARSGLTRDDLMTWFRRQVLSNNLIAQKVVAGVAQADQQNTYKTWFNDLQSRAQTEMFLGSADGAVAKVGSPAPDFTTTSADGQSLRLSSYKGKGVILNFWATWCPPCRAEMPYITKVSEEYKDKGLVVVGIDMQEAAELVTPFLKQFSMQFPVGLDLTGEIANTYRVRAIPTTYFIDSQGVIQQMHRGSISEALLRQYAKSIAVQ